MHTRNSGVQERHIDEEQDLKDFARSTGQLDVVYSETGRNDGKGYVWE